MIRPITCNLIRCCYSFLFFFFILISPGIYAKAECSISTFYLLDEPFIPIQNSPDGTYISSFSPASGAIGTLVTIKGTGFTGLTSFTIGGVSAITVSNTDSTLVGMVMPGSLSGIIALSARDGSAVSSSNFTVIPLLFPNAQQGQKITGADEQGAGFLGYSVAVSADGNTAITGAFFDNSYIGAAFIYTRSNGVWSQQGPKLVGSGAQGNSYQGISVGISADGNTVIMGGNADQNSIGASWIFTRTGNTWAQQGPKLSGNDAKGNPGQGYSVSMSADGNTVLVGGLSDNGGAGASWIYTRSGITWSQAGTKLVGTGATGNAVQGYFVSLSADGRTALVGGKNDNNGSGSSWVFVKSGNGWVQQGAKLVGAGNIGNAQQGSSLALSADGNIALVGGFYDNYGIGAAWIFSRTAGTWIQSGAKLVGTGNSASSGEGTSVALSADGVMAMVSGYLDSQNGVTAVFTRNGNNWVQQTVKIVGSGTSASSRHGLALSSDGTTLINGGFTDNNNNGAIWAFIPGTQPPIISTTGTLTKISGRYGTSSDPQKFNVSGSNLTSGISLSAPSGFELSTDSSTYYNKITISSGGTVNAVPVYIRLAAMTHKGNYSGNIIISSDGASTINEATASSNQASGLLTIVTDSIVSTYGTALPTFTFKYKGFVNADSPDSLKSKPAVTTSALQGSHAGKYTLTATGAVDSNYTIQYTAGLLTIGKAALTIAADNQSSIYGSALPALTYSYTGLVYNDTKDSISISPAVTTSALQGSHAGKYTLTAAGAVDSNYTISYTSGTLTIGKAALTIAADNQSSMYGTALPALTYSYTGLVYNDTKDSISISPAVTTSALQGSHAGKYTLTAAGAVDSNYTISYTSGTLTIGKAALTIAADNQTSMYGAVLPALSYTYSGLVYNDTKDSITLKPAVTTSAKQGSHAGKYTLTAAGAVDSNYTISYTSGTLTIGKAALTIAADNQSSMYGAVLPALTYTYTGLVYNDTKDSIFTKPTVTTSASQGSTVGKYILSAAGAVDSNYTISYNQGILVIGKAPLTILAENKQSTYGAPIPALTYTFTGFVNKDTPASLTIKPSLSTTAVQGSPVGKYALVASGAADSNYTIQYSLGMLTVVKAPLFIIAENKQSSYGAPIPALTNTFSGFVNKDTPASLTLKSSLNTTAVPGSPVGQYSIIVSNAADSNYSIAFLPARLTIIPAILTVEANDQFRLYGQPNPVLSVSYSGFVNGDDSTKIKVKAITSTKATVKSFAGTYTILVSRASIANYTIVYNEGKLQIGQAFLQLTADSRQKIYGQPNPAITVHYSGFVNGEDSYSLKVQPSFYSAANQGVYTAAGSYPITVTNAADPNYVISYSPGMFTVLQAPLTLTASDTTKNYGQRIDDQTSSTAFTTTGLQNLETIGSLRMVYGQGRATADAVGNYSGSVQPSAVTGGTALLSNYLITYTSGSIHVLAISPVITTPAATNLTSAGVTLNATATDGGALTTVILKYSTDPTLKSAKVASFNTGSSPLSPGSGKTRFRSSLSGLTSGTTYYYQVSASNSAGTALSSVLSFTTLSTNASLASANVSSGGLSPAFSSNIYTYSSTASSKDNSVSLSLLTADPNATVQVNGMLASSAGITNLNLRTGNNPVQILVTAQDGITQLSYLINIYRVIAQESLLAGNILSPNHDGTNDVWVIKDIQYYPNNSVTVYDRLGRVVYFKKGYANDWGATSRGLLLNEDTYYYLVDFGPGERKMKGFISVVRDL